MASMKRPKLTWWSRSPRLSASNPATLSRESVTGKTVTRPKLSKNGSRKERAQSRTDSNELRVLPEDRANGRQEQKSCLWNCLGSVQKADALPVGQQKLRACAPHLPPYLPQKHRGVKNPVQSC